MDLSKIIQESGLRTEVVAERLFPENTHPYAALRRVLRDGRSLRADQITALAELTGRSTDDLLGYPALNWKGFSIEFDRSECLAKVQAGGRECYIPYKPEMPVGEFLKTVENQF